MGDLKSKFRDAGLALNIVPEHKVTYNGKLYEINLDKDKASVKKIDHPRPDQLEGSVSLSEYKRDLGGRLDDMKLAYNSARGQGLGKLPSITSEANTNLYSAYTQLQNAYNYRGADGANVTEKLRDKLGDENPLYTANRDAEMALPGIKAEMSGLAQVDRLAGITASAKPVPSTAPGVGP